MSLIRNGGFEIGNLDFWEMETPGVLTQDDTDMNRGAGCAKLVSSGAGTEYMINRDYVKVAPFEMLILSGWVKSVHEEYFRLYAVEYDEDLNIIDSHLVAFKYTAVGYTQLTGEHIIGSEASYMRLQMAIQGSDADEVFFMDDASVSRFDPSGTSYKSERIADIDDATATDGTANDKRSMKGYDTYYADIRTSDVSGTNPTCDVVVYDYNDQAHGVVVGTFAQKTGTEYERIALTSVTGSGFYIVYTIGGTTPSFDILVDIIGKR